MTIAQEAPVRTRFPKLGLGGGDGRARQVARTLGWATVGAAGALLVWQAAAAATAIPGPVESLRRLGTLLWYPFYDLGPNDKGIGRQLALSLQRVGIGFFFASLVGIPLGLFIGANRRAWMAINPVVQMLRPVSPLAWFPIWLVVFRDNSQAAILVIFMTALWPTVLNTAAGAGSIPEDQRRVAAVFKFGRLAYLRHILVPNTLPSIVTGLRLSMGIAWMVIVAVEMLSSGTGIGFFVWNSYNADDMPSVLASVLIIGAVGLLLDLGFLRLAKAVSLGKAA
ncbi:MAG TPA: nitrate ABC transporter permease [Acidimicrobiales bacterium]|nr:nitrate ABC transporter permease [Acidimicrobiales bacterium]